MHGVTQLVRVKHGSHLYGTSTPQSDTDWKGVHLPSGEAIILGRAENHISKNIVAKNGTKNTSDAVDDESFSLQRFFEMLMKGDTVATEILFAKPEWEHPDWREVQAVGRSLLNRQCKGFVGYCVRQAAKYGIKGSRMSAVKDVLDFLKLHSLGLPNTAKLGFLLDKLNAWSKGREHVSWENIAGGHGSAIWHLNVCDRKMPMTATIKDAIDVWQKVWDNYGQRARDAADNKNVDWKAVSHAVRVANQAIELLDFGRITFPRPEAQHLLAIKQGKFSYDTVSGQLEHLVQKVQHCSEHSRLPEKSDHKLADALVKRMYLEQVQ